MKQSRGGRIILKRYNWELPGLVSLVAAVAASLYAVTPGFNPVIAAAVYIFSLFSGLVSIVQQIHAAKARIVTFSKESWKLDGQDLVLEIESDFMLFRVETRKDHHTFQEVMGETETSEDGKITRVRFAAGVSDDQLEGRIVVR
jgi:hypothetical protein